MTPYLTSIDTFSLSRTVFEMFDFKRFRVWPWPLTLKGHLRSIFLKLFESPYVTSYLTSIDTFYLLPFSRYSTSYYTKFDLWPLKVIWGQKNFIPFESPWLYDFLFDFYGHHLFISYRSRENAGKNFEGRTKWRILTFQRSRSWIDFFLSRKSTSSHQTASFEILRIKIGSSCLGCTCVKKRKKF